jgi:hypothetical protein
MPTITEGILEVCKNYPEDPVGALADFIYKSMEESNEGV